MKLHPQLGRNFAQLGRIPQLGRNFERNPVSAARISERTLFPKSRAFPQYVADRTQGHKFVYQLVLWELPLYHVNRQQVVKSFRSGNYWGGAILHCPCLMSTMHQQSQELKSRGRTLICHAESGPEPVNLQSGIWNRMSARQHFAGTLSTMARHLGLVRSLCTKL